MVSSPTNGSPAMVNEPGRYGVHAATSVAAATVAIATIVGVLIAGSSSKSRA